MLAPLLEVASIIGIFPSFKIIIKIKTHQRMIFFSGRRDPNIIPPQKALEVLMSLMSDMIPKASAILITGYPRSMSDVVEYMARVKLFTNLRA